MDKFSRNYILAVQTQSGSVLIIKPPFTIEFDITRNILTSANVCQVRIYNLSTVNRNQLRFDISNYGELRGIELKAGYGTNLPVVFAGNISQAWSVREGVNMITQIECFDGGYALANGNFDQQFLKGTLQETVIKNMISSALPGITMGTIGQIDGSLSKGDSYSGNTANLLAQLSPGSFFIDNRKANVLSDSECLKGEIDVIDAQTGLLGTPVREQTIINFEMLFEPRLVIAQKIQLKSSTDINFNGFYKVISLKHRGMISESVCGDAITSVGMFYGASALKVVEQAAS